MATDRILDATACLTAAIEGIQEAPPDEHAAIQALRTLLLGGVPLTEPTSPHNSTPRPINEVPVFIWSLEEVQNPTRDVSINSPTSVPSRAGTLAIIEDNADNESLPPTLLRRSPRSNATLSTTTGPARLSTANASEYFIGAVIDDTTGDVLEY